MSSLEFFFGEENNFSKLHFVVELYNILNATNNVEGEVNFEHYLEKVCDEIEWMFVDRRSQNEGIMFILILVAKKLT